MKGRLTRSSGFTLMEVLMVTVLAAGLITTVTMGLNITTSQAQTIEIRYADAERIMAEIEHGIRMAQSVEKADSNILTLTTRYFHDTDDELEEIHYVLSGGILYKEIIDDGTSTGPPEPILDNVTSFWTSALRIEDKFLAAEYDGASFIEGETLSADRSIKVDYKLWELGQVDPDLVDSYDSAGEKLAIQSADSTFGKTVTVTPPIKRANLTGAVRFVPINPDSEYRPLVYGDVSPDSTNISLVFSNDGTIDVRCYVGATLRERINAGYTWVAGKAYDVKLVMDMEYARAFVKFDGTWKEVGSISAGVVNCDMRAFHLQTMTAGAIGTWDDVNVEYPFVDVHLGVFMHGATKNFYGGAVRRQP